MLREFQSDFADAILEGAMAPLAASVVEDGVPAEVRLGIYRNNVFHSLIDALKELYPVVQRLVGEEFFRATAREYIHRNPPKSPALVNLGGDFAEFLAQFPPTLEMAYLSDVARLELAWHEAYHAPDAVSLTAADLQGISADSFADLRLSLHPSRRFVRSAFPVDRIWEVNSLAGDVEETIDLASGGVGLMVIRPRFDVEVRSFPPAAFAFLSVLDGGGTISEACFSALQKDETFDVEETLSSLIAGETFAGFEM